MRTISRFSRSLILCGVLLTPCLAVAQGLEYAQTLYAPLLQSTSAGDLGIALSNPTRSAIQVIATARSFAGETIGGPVVLTLPPLGQRAYTTAEVFPGITGRTGWVAVQSPSTSVSGMFLLFDGNLNYIDGGEMPNAPQTRIVFPKVYSFPGNSSRVSYANTSSTSFDAVLTIYNNFGGIQIQKTITLAAYSGFNGPISELVPGVTFTGFATLESLVSFPRSLIGLVTNTNGFDNAVLLAQPLGTGIKVGYIPHLAIQGGYTSRLSLVNAESVDQSVRLTFVFTDLFGNNISLSFDRVLQAKNRFEMDIDPLYGSGGSSVPIAGYVRFEVLGETPGIWGHIEFGTTNGVLLSAVPALGAAYSDYSFSHIAEGPGYYTGLALLNPNAEVVPVAIDVLDRSGNRVGGRVINMQGGERRARLFSELIPGLQQLGGSVRVSSPRNIFALELFGSSNSLRFAANVSARGAQVEPRVSGGGGVVPAATGALVVSADARVSQLIPPKSVDGDFAVQLQVVDPSTFAKPLPDQRLMSVIEALPSGVQFNIPTKMFFPTGAQLPPGTQLPLYIQNALTGFQFRPSEFVATVDDTGRNAAATVTHFTHFGVLWPDSLSLNVTGISPQQGTTGTLILIQGPGFSTLPGTNLVTFAGPDNTALQAPVISASDTALAVLVPQGAVTGDILVRSGERVSRGVRFVSLNSKPIPTVTSVTPTTVSSVAPFLSILITGTGFTAESQVLVSGVPALSAVYLGPTTMRVELFGPLAIGTYQIGVRNPTPGGGFSNTATLFVQ